MIPPMAPTSATRAVDTPLKSGKLSGRRVESTRLTPMTHTATPSNSSPSLEIEGHVPPVPFTASSIFSPHVPRRVASRRPVTDRAVTTAESQICGSVASSWKAGWWWGCHTFDHHKKRFGPWCVCLSLLCCVFEIHSSKMCADCPSPTSTCRAGCFSLRTKKKCSLFCGLFLSQRSYLSRTADSPHRHGA